MRRSDGGSDWDHFYVQRGWEREQDVCAFGGCGRDEGHRWGQNNDGESGASRVRGWR